ncbi:CYFA0S24e01772g1_1 [Cyberlindnera fabianii]|uniref:CYFA0S24e01772g1_1 n=1 Tax=Cyberlindnera fabianii TaxID=36022 RepID=A0A061BFI0_CYBFA|nr:CYFA0S24e01772g1_1 [Cyberlindnera fabianii]
MDSGTNDLLPVESVSKCRDPSKRASLQSGISEFSFENSSDSTEPQHSLTQTIATSRSMDKLQSPTKPSSKLEQLVKKNNDLESRFVDQNMLISALRAHIRLLETTLRDNSIDVPPFTEPTILKEAVIRSLNIDPARSKNLDKLSLPPRSADRLKTTRSPDAQRTASSRSQDASRQLDERNEGDTSTNTILGAANKPVEEKEDDLNEDYSLMVAKEEQGSITPTSEVISMHNEELPEPDDIADVLSPDSSRINVDWNATIEALKSSAEDEPVVQTVDNKVQMTPYSGRIASPSPYKSHSDSLSPQGSNISSSITTPQIIANTTIPQASIPSPQSHRNMPPVSPIKFTSQRPYANREPSSGSLPITPAISIRAPSVSGPSSHTTEQLPTPTAPPADQTPLSRSNLYDPFTADFRQQAYRDYTENSTPQSIQQSFTSQQQPQEQPSYNPQDQPLPPTPTYPSDVPLFVDPAHLGTVKPEIISTIHGNPTKKSDDPYVSIAVLDRQTNKEMWRFRKSLSQIVLLDTEIRPMINSFSLPPVPEKSLFLTNIPTKVDSRRTRIKDYFATLFSIPNIPLDGAYKLARFMSLDVINLLDESNMDVLKEGWLLRRAKGLGNNWKARYCQLDGPFINVYDGPDGQMVEIIKLQGSQIGRQPDDLKGSDDKSAFRHAFAVMEPKKGLKSGSFTKHIFCAETDIERDLWVNVLVQLLDTDAGSSYISGSGQSIYSSESTTVESVATPMKENGVSPASMSQSSPVKEPLSSAASIDLRDPELAAKEAKRQKKRSFFPFSKKQVNDQMEMYRQQQESPNSILESSIERSLQGMDLNSPVLNKTTVFQNELTTVVSLSSHEMYGVAVPSIVFRCLSYLIDRSAVYEEGIFRLSGSSAMIKQLRSEFDQTHDVDFNALEPRPDINTVAGLLKLWLRELPSNILTKDLYPRFKDCCGNIRDPAQLAREYSKLAMELPRENIAVLYALFKFLNDVINNKDSNKMNLRNLCIVFSPTLNIATDVIVPFLVDFRCVFEGGEPVDMAQREDVDLNIPTF